MNNQLIEDYMKEEMVKNIKSKKDFILFVHLLIKDYDKNPELWKNRDIPSFLDALASLLESKDKGEKFSGDPSWMMFAEMILEARSYEISK